MLPSYRPDSSTWKALPFESVFCPINKGNRSSLWYLGRSHPYSDSAGKPSVFTTPDQRRVSLPATSLQPFWSLALYACPQNVLSAFSTSNHLVWTLPCMKFKAKGKLHYSNPRGYFSAVPQPYCLKKAPYWRFPTPLFSWKFAKEIINLAILAW